MKGPGRTTLAMPHKNRNRRLIVIILACVVIASIPLLYALVRNYRLERNQPARTVVPNLIGLDLEAGKQRAQASKLDTSVIGKTWYSDLPPGRISLQAPEAGERVPVGTVIGVEITVAAPPGLGSPTAVQGQKP